MMMAVNIFEMSPRSGSSLSVVIGGSSINMDPKFAIYLLTMSAVAMRDRKISRFS